jgi:phosphoenolpyruvate synthase/pyruvate phosphate dikinase
MVPAEAAGVILTLDPVTGDPSAIVVEASYGLGAAVVNGEVMPDRACIDKVLLGSARGRSAQSRWRIALIERCTVRVSKKYHPSSGKHVA